MAGTNMARAVAEAVRRPGAHPGRHRSHSVRRAGDAGRLVASIAELKRAEIVARNQGTVALINRIDIEPDGGEL